MKAIAGVLLLAVAVGGVYLAVNRGAVFAQTPSTDSSVCSNATLNGTFSLVLLESHEARSTFSGNPSVIPSSGFNSVRATATFDGVNTATFTLTQRIWSVAGSQSPGPVQYPGGFNPISSQTASFPYQVNPDCTMQIQNLFIQIMPGGPPPWNRTFLLIDGVTASVDFGPTNPPSQTQVRDIFFVGIGVSK